MSSVRANDISNDNTLSVRVLHCFWQRTKTSPKAAAYSPSAREAALTPTLTAPLSSRRLLSTCSTLRGSRNSHFEPRGVHTHLTTQRGSQVSPPVACSCTHTQPRRKSPRFGQMQRFLHKARLARTTIDRIESLHASVRRRTVSRSTISPKIITVLTRYRPIVLELI